jgi:hypothetical protein
MGEAKRRNADRDARVKEAVAKAKRDEALRKLDKQLAEAERQQKKREKLAAMTPAERKKHRQEELEVQQFLIMGSALTANVFGNDASSAFSEMLDTKVNHRYRPPPKK